MSSDASKIYHHTSDASGYLGPEVYKIDHADAWNVAHVRRDESNLARAYIELRQAVKDAFDPEYEKAVAATNKMEAISKANDL